MVQASILNGPKTSWFSSIICSVEMAVQQLRQKLKVSKLMKLRPELGTIVALGYDVR